MSRHAGDLSPLPRERGDTFIGPVAPLESMLRDWHARLSARGGAMLTGAAALDAYLGCRTTFLA